MSEDKPIDKTSTQEVCDYLTQQSEHLPAGVETRLHRARLTALTADSVASSPMRGLMWPVAGAAVSGLAAVLLWVGQPAKLDHSDNTKWLASNDWNIVLNDQDFDLVANELDFYHWLAEQENSG